MVSVIWGYLLSAVLACSASAEHHVEPLPKVAQPSFFQRFVHPTKDGMLTALPVVDSDPNSGVTFGIMPIWVVNRSTGDERMHHIHSLALTRNENAGMSAQYQLFLFPDESSSAEGRVGVSKRFDREVVAEYSSERFLDRPLRFNGRFEYSKDSTKRFYGFGPKTSSSGESNYTLDTVNYRAALGVPFGEGSPWRFTLMNRFEANDVTNGGVEKIPDLEARYPEVFRTVSDRNRNISLRGYLEYDSRDSDVTPTRGAYVAPFIGGAHKDLALTDYSYYRYGLEAKRFLPWGGSDGEPRSVTAARVRFEDLRGDVPFWLLPEMGGKYSHRAYGEGRFFDHSLLIFGAEQRVRVYSARVRGSTASFWIDPFFAFGSVAARPEKIEARYLRPVYGVALRLVVRRLIVASADFGVGQEGLKVFLDINYSF